MGYRLFAWGSTLGRFSVLKTALGLPTYGSRRKQMERIMANKASETVEVLDLAFYGEPGERIALTFPTPAARDQFRNRLTAEIMRSIRRNLRLDPKEPGYGESDWPGLNIHKEGALGLVLGRGLVTPMQVFRERPDGSRIPVAPGDEKKLDIPAPGDQVNVEDPLPLRRLGEPQ